MDSKSFEKPDFLGNELKTRWVGGGTFTEVASIDNLPTELLSKIPDGYVIKKYKKDSYKRLFKDPTKVFASGDEYLGLSAEDKVQVLQKRQKFVKDFFKDVLPDIVVGSNYVLGGKSSDDAEIYEIQPKLEKNISLKSLDYDEKALEFLSTSARCNLLEQLKLFLARAQEMPSKSDGFMVDIFGENLIVLPDGNLKMFDTNLLFHKYDDGYMDETMEETYGFSLRTIGRIIGKLKV